MHQKLVCKFSKFKNLLNNPQTTQMIFQHFEVMLKALYAFFLEFLIDCICTSLHYASLFCPEEIGQNLLFEQFPCMREK